MSEQSNRTPIGERLTHIAFIMDGNGRWAKARNMPREYGHKAGAETFRRVTDYCNEIGIKVVTVYALSTENMARPKNEVAALMELLRRYLREALSDADKNKIRFIFIGSRKGLDDTLVSLMNEVEAATAKYAGLHTLNLAINYGGREEIVSACKAVVAEGAELTEESIGSHLYTRDTPPPDLIIRTAGERRLSNFLLWQSSYAEFYYTDTLWPDMSEKDVDEAVEDYLRRERRFGKVKE